MKNFDPRTSFAIKCAAVVLLLACGLGAAAGSVVVALRSAGYGSYPTFREDPLCTEFMSAAANYALIAVTDGGDYSTDRLSTVYAGFSAEVYRRNLSPENFAGTWSAIPNEVLAEQTFHLRGSWEGGAMDYTVVGYLSTSLPPGSVASRNLEVYNILHSFPYEYTMALAVLLYLACAALLGYLLWSCGHRAGVEGIALNWQDRIPLDLYLLCVSIALVITSEIAARFLYWNRTGFLSTYIIPLCLSLLAMAVLALATLLTLATRFKRGRWWRNSICFFAVYMCWLFCKRCWNSLMAFVRILPLTWRTVLGVAGVLFVQSCLVALILVSWYGPPFLLFLLAMDAALAVAAAWLTRQLQQVKDMGDALAAGDLEAKLDTRKMYWDIKAHAESLNAIGVGMNRAVEQRMKSEHLKTELITNVSHDIKTPLTSIVNYVDLLRKEELPPAAAEYALVLERQARKLKKLTEDLVEASKASTGNITVNLEPIVVNEIVHQAIGDYDERLTAGKLEVILSSYEGNLMALADGRLLWRVLDNLLGNVCKYAMAGTRVYVDLGVQDGRVFLTIKNISRDPLNVSADELMERFVRGDASRHTEGSGLGLNIARSLMDLMGGTFGLDVDGDLFKAELTLQAA